MSTSFDDQPPENNPENLTTRANESRMEHMPENIPKPFDDFSLYDPRKELFKVAMSREWNEVLKLYRYGPALQSLPITRANDTLLHVAISGATEKTVLDLLNIIVETNKQEMGHILSVKNKAGDTPLHLAATLGLEKVCRRMAKLCPEMVTSARNDLHETPLFSAVRYGQKNVFFVLEAAIRKEGKLNTGDYIDIAHCRRGDGNNILHYAIKGEQFDLAYEIIGIYPVLVNYVNSRGETALHTLANKPSVFKSGARFGFYDTIIYHCAITEPLKFQFPDFLENEKKHEEEKPSDIEEDENKVLPPTCKVCIDLFYLMKHSISCIFNIIAFAAPRSTDEKNPKSRSADEENPSGAHKEHRRRIPPNYDVTISFFKIIVKLLLVVLGIGLRRLHTISKLKQKHRNAKKIMKVLVDESRLWEYEEAKGGWKPDKYPFSDDIIPKSPPSITSVETTDHPGSDKNTPNPSEDENVLIRAVKETGRDIMQNVLDKCCLKTVEGKESTNKPDTVSPVLVAAKMGITEMVKRILEKFPVAIVDKDKDKKNIVLLAVEHRQVHVYTYMLGVPFMESVFRKGDKDGNSALHLAAMLSHSRPWSIPGAALQMQWESKWYKYVHGTMKLEILKTTNKYGKTPEEVFIDSHDILVKEGSTWLINTSQSCSVVAALVATVAFASASTVPGGVDSESGFPVLSKRPAFQMFAISSLVALCFSVTSLVMFLAILTSRYQARDFNRGLPLKLILGLTSLFMSIASMLVSFCAGDFFVVERKLKFAVYPIYIVMCFPVTFFAVVQLPLYIDLIKATIKKVPERTEKINVY